MEMKLSDIKDKESLIQFIKFGIVGVTNTLLGLFIYYIFVLINKEWYQLGNVVSWLISVNFLRGMFKSENANQFIKLAYLTGILPIKKYGTQSALNNFKEYSMVAPKKLAEYIGFSEEEVKIFANNMEWILKNAKDGITVILLAGLRLFIILILLLKQC